MPTRLITAPAELPVTLTEAKEHLRVTVTDEDALILSLMYAATEWAEAFTNRKFITQTWELVLDEFPKEFDVPNAPLASVTHIKYLDTDDAEQTLASAQYQVDAVSDPGRIVLDPDSSWPDISDKINAVTVRFVCGYGLAAAVPFAIKAAILLIVGHLFENRELVVIGTLPPQELPLSASALLAPYRVWRL
jgi:uncharacterized phiE125 gp8 family phage protein